MGFLSLKWNNINQNNKPNNLLVFLLKSWDSVIPLKCYLVKLWNCPEESLLSYCGVMSLYQLLIKFSACKIDASNEGKRKRHRDFSSLLFNVIYCWQKDHSSFWTLWKIEGKTNASNFLFTQQVVQCTANIQEGCPRLFVYRQSVLQVGSK